MGLPQNLWVAGYCRRAELWRFVTDGRRSVKGIRVGVAVKCASKCAPTNQHFNAHFNATLNRIPLNDQLSRSPLAK
jgi:hypothetical protein